MGGFLRPCITGPHRGVGYTLNIATYWILSLSLRAMVRRQPWIMGPLVPLTFTVAYQADLAYGNKMERILGESNPHHHIWQSY